jgi:hypothetical protein
MRVTCATILVALGALAAGCNKRPTPVDADGIGEEARPQFGAAPKRTFGKLGTFTVGPETTYVSGPMTPDGHIDYAAALNERLASGVVPESNASVAIWRVLGPNSSGIEPIPAGFFERMGMTAPPAAGSYFVGLRTYCARHAPEQTAAASAKLDDLSKRPWADTESAIVVEWLGANDKPLTALREAVKRPQYYNPLVPSVPEKGLATTAYPLAFVCRELVLALHARAMLDLERGNVTEAWQDLLASHRLGRQIARGGTLLEAMVGCALEHLTCRAEVAYLDRAKPDAQAIRDCVGDLLALPRLAFDQIRLAERLWCLDLIMQIDRHGIEAVPVYGADLQPVRHGLRDEDLRGVDWDPALAVAVRGYDRLAAAFVATDRAIRVERVREIAAEGQAREEQFVSGRAAAALKAAGSAAARGREFGEMVFAGTAGNFGKCLDATDRAQQTFGNLVVAYALAGYQRANGRYPAALADLAPDHLRTVPADLFSGRGLVYRPTPDGFLLYSVGANGTDDEGRGIDANPPGDDLVVRLPLPAKP